MFGWAWGGKGNDGAAGGDGEAGEAGSPGGDGGDGASANDGLTAAEVMRNRRLARFQEHERQQQQQQQQQQASVTTTATTASLPEESTASAITPVDNEDDVEMVTHDDSNDQLENPEQKQQHQQQQPQQQQQQQQQQIQQQQQQQQQQEQEQEEQLQKQQQQQLAAARSRLLNAQPQSDSTSSSTTTAATPPPPAKDFEMEMTPKKKRKDVEMAMTPKKKEKETPRRAGDAAADISELLCRVFMVKVGEYGRSIRHGVELVGVACDLTDANQRVCLSFATLEQALVERLQMGGPGGVNPEDASYFEYLVNCYRRLLNEENTMAVQRSEEKQALLRDAKTLLVAYWTLLMQNPSFFVADGQRQASLPKQLHNLLVFKSDFPHEILNMVVTKVLADTESMLALVLGGGASTDGTSESESKSNNKAQWTAAQMDAVMRTFKPLLKCLQREMRKLSVMDSFLPYVHVLEVLSSNRALATAITGMECWMPSEERLASAMEIELKTFLGPFLSLRPYSKATREHFFPSELMSQGEIGQAFDTLRSALNNAAHSLKRVFLQFLKASTLSRNRLLDYVAKTLAMNVNRAKTQYDKKLVSSHGFMMMITSVMVKLCPPFLIPAKISAIDVEYLTSAASRIDVTGETKLVASAEEVGEWVDRHNLDNLNRYRQYVLRQTAGQAALDAADKEKLSDGGDDEDEEKRKREEKEAAIHAKPPNFITECFYLTSFAYHLGYRPLWTDLMELQKQVHRVGKEKKKFEKEHRANAERMGGFHLAQFEAHLKKFEEFIKSHQTQMIALQTQIFDPALKMESMDFYVHLSNWILRVVDPEEKGLPLPTPSMAYRSLPEYLVQDMVDFFYNQLSSQQQAAVIPPNYVPIKDVAVAFSLLCGCAEHLKNPYLRTHMAGVLKYLVPNKKGGTFSGTLFPDVFVDNPRLQKNIVSSITQLYVDIEFTGSHTQFYEKYDCRRHLIAILDYLWTLDDRYKVALKEDAEDEDKFVRFINMIINDTTFHLDEGLLSLAKIHDVETEMADEVAWRAKTDAEREEATTALDRAQQLAPYYMTTGPEELHMFAFLSRDLPQPFLRPELVDRIASLVNYLLVQVVGPKCMELKVRDRDRYHFDPKRLLSQLGAIYINFVSHQSFLEAVARDGRSYSAQVFHNAYMVLKKFALMSDDDLALFQTLMTRSEEYYKSAEDEQDLFADAPDEFLDPITCSIMNDPVILPSSKTVVDRTMISRHLLSDETDPFNRSPLTADMLVDDVELKKKIEAWVEEKRKGARSQAGGVAE
eukprot:TRINITY_DN5239_c3_g1_i1.p1 TRINITY_DN5239_c3_g1~~TRINITY_DN5239_c3_g1_i1.p1  ORF type:complete len:1278 (+),score=450.43 TRINITY_DN5239_c3_g1_i1:198-4031(+)